MKTIFSRTLSPSFAVSILALAMALGGGAAYATSRGATQQAATVRCFNISHFQNGWKNASKAFGFHKVEVCKDSLGYVHLDGLLTAGSAFHFAFRLPKGDRPRANHAWAVAAGAGVTSPVPSLEDVDVLSNGEVEMVGPVTDAVSLDGVTFHVG